MWGAGATVWLAGLRYEVTGLENLQRERACVYMANHQSNLDPPLLFVLLPPQLAVMGKRQLFSIPVLGAAMRLGQFVSVDRENPQAARASVEKALPILQGGKSFLVYPEGRRSFDGRILRFKHGVFVLAIRAGVPIVPITVHGATDVMPKGKWEVYPGHVRVTIHKPVETAGRTLTERAQLAEEVRAIIASALPEELRPAPAAAPVPVAADFDDTL